MARPTETRAPARAAKSPAARTDAAPTGNGRAPRNPATIRRARRPSAEPTGAMNAKELENESAPEAEPTQAPSASASSASAGQATPAPRPMSPTPVASDRGGADLPTGVASDLSLDESTEPEHASAPAHQPATPRPGQGGAEQAQHARLAWLDGSARLRGELAGFARAQIEDAIATGQAILTCGSLPKAVELQASYAVRALQGNVVQAMRLAKLSVELMPAGFTPRKPS